MHVLLFRLLIFNKKYSNSNKAQYYIEEWVMWIHSALKYPMKWVNRGMKLECTANSIFIIDFHDSSLVKRALIKEGNPGCKSYHQKTLMFCTLIGASVLFLDVASDLLIFKGCKGQGDVFIQFCLGPWSQQWAWMVSPADAPPWPQVPGSGAIYSFTHYNPALGAWPSLPCSTS